MTVFEINIFYDIFLFEMLGLRGILLRVNKELTSRVGKSFRSTKTKVSAKLFLTVKIFQILR